MPNIKTVTQFIWQDALEMPAFEPVENKKGKYGQDKNCFLCGGETLDRGWHKKDVITSSFTDVDKAKDSYSLTVCDSCASTIKAEAYKLACEKFDKSPYFPIKEDKKPMLCNWMFSSHVLSKNNWLQPSRKEMRDILLDPPIPPFVITIADAGKKHILFRADINYSRDRFSVMLDEEKIAIKRNLYKEMLAEFEKAYALGFSKTSLLSGDYNQAAIMKTGIKKWQEVESIISDYRNKDYALLKVVSFVAKKDEE